jgi:hypothetical protein
MVHRPLPTRQDAASQGWWNDTATGPFENNIILKYLDDIGMDRPMPGFRAGSLHSKNFGIQGSVQPC